MRQIAMRWPGVACASPAPTPPATGPSGDGHRRRTGVVRTDDDPPPALPGIGRTARSSTACAGRAAGDRPLRAAAADPATPTPAVAAAGPGGAPPPRPRTPTHLPVTGPGGVAILAGLSLALAAAGLLLLPGPPAGRRDPDLPAALRPPARSGGRRTGRPPQRAALVAPVGSAGGQRTLDEAGHARSSIERSRRAGNGGRRDPVGRRGQGEGHRPPGQGDGDGRPLPGRAQRRSHHRRRRRAVRPAAAPVGDPLRPRRAGDRQRCRRRPGGAAGRDRRARRPRASTAPGCG